MSADDLLEELWAAIEADDADATLARLRALEEGDAELAGSPEGLHLRGLALLSLEHDLKVAREMLEAAYRADPDQDGLAASVGDARYQLWDFEGARAALEHAARLDREDAWVQRTLAVCLDRLGERKRAERAFALAHRLDPEAFPLPPRLSEDEFAALARRAVDALPRWVLERLQGVPIAVLDYPELRMLADDPAEADPDTLGVFAGEAIPDRYAADGPVVHAPTIHLFQRNLEHAVGDRSELREEVRITVHHEVGHLLGFDEDGLDRIGLA